MIKIDVSNNAVRCDISHDAKINECHFPLKFQVLQLITNEIIWEVELNLGTWAIWNNARDKNFRVVTKENIILKQVNYDYSWEDLNIYEFWDYFCILNNKTVGLILGAGNGTWGEWIVPIHREKIKCHLVEASDSTFLELKKVCGHNPNFVLHNSLISTDGLEYKFYEGSHHNGLNTIDYDYLKKIDNEALPDFVIKKSKNIQELLYEIGKIDWIRIDLEGIDYDIIKKIPTFIIKSLILIQYEHHNLSDNKRKEIDDIILPLGFRKKIYNIDTIYIK